MFALIVLLIHAHQQQLRMAEDAAAPSRLALPLAQRIFPAADQVSDEVDAWGRQQVLAADGTPLGSILQTAPQSNSIVGFSGPTNLLIGFDVQNRLTRVEILASQDTRDHVEQVRRDPTFLAAWQGADWSAAAHDQVHVDAVAGATLTSLAIQQAIVERLGGVAGSLRFPGAPPLTLARQWFPAAETLRAQRASASGWDVLDARGARLGSLQHTAPAADHIAGYQGPTEAWIGLAADGQIVGLNVGRSFDNEPYVSYVREDQYFGSLFNGHRLEQLVGKSLEDLQIEGVSGATMTSQAVAEGILQTAADWRARQQQVALPTTARQRNQGAQRKPGIRSFRINTAVPFSAPQAINSRSESAWQNARTWGTAAVVAAGIIIALTPLRGRRRVRQTFQLVLIAYLGLVNGDMVSQALIVGWAQHGIPWRLAAGLVVLTSGALVLPVVTSRNVYCTHLCPHGAVQQLVRNRLPWQLSLPRRLTTFLRLVPALLLVVSLLAGMGVLRISLVDIEPFDAWLFYVAGPVAITLALVGLIAACFVPMAYCRFGCPTGALLNYLRCNSRSGHWTMRDTFAVICAAMALCLYLR